MAADRVVRSRRVVLPDGIRPASIHIQDGIIAEIGDHESTASDDFGNSVIMAGLVDTHVHINEPGRTEWEGFSSATRAAAAGGITTIVEMPLNSIPSTTSSEAYAAKLRAAEEKCWIDVGFWGGVIPKNADQIRPLWEEGCFGFKCFLVPSGVEEFPHVDEASLRSAMLELGRCGAVLMVHAELPSELQAPAGDARHYRNYLRSRPRNAENRAIDLLIRLSRETGCKVHIVHLSSCDAVPMLQNARSGGLPITVETCPHYLVFNAEEIPDGATEFKCAPPIREAANRDSLWEALRSGAIDMVVSDHSPSPPTLKRREEGDFFGAWGGIASLQLTLPAVWSECRRRGFTIENLASWMCAAPAKLAGLANKKGIIGSGHDADLVVWDPETEFVVDPGGLYHRHKLTPYAGMRLAGVVKRTYLRGMTVDPNGRPQGKMLRRGRL